MLFPFFQSLNISDSYAKANDLDPNVQPSDVPETTYDEFHDRGRWREKHAMERVSYSDPTFRTFLSTNERTPEHAVHKNCGDCRKCDASCRRYCKCARARREAAKNTSRIKSLPPEDLVFTLGCRDGAISFGRKALMLLRTEQRAGRIDVHACTIAQIRALIGVAA